MIDSIYQEARDKMGEAVVALNNELKKVRTGRASLNILDGIRVDYYGTQTPLNQMASLSVPESRLITIQPWDVTVIGAIEKAILKSNIGLTPSNDGKLIRISIPPLTEERRRDLSKQVHSRTEEARIAIRNIRRDEINDLREMERESMISEDDLHRGQDKIQEKTDAYIKRADEIMREKEEEIMTI